MKVKVADIKKVGTTTKGNKFWWVTLRKENGEGVDAYIFKDHLKEGDELEGEFTERERNGKTFIVFKQKPQKDNERLLHLLDATLTYLEKIEETLVEIKKLIEK